MLSGTRFPENMWGGIKRNFFRMGLLYYYYHHRRRCFLLLPLLPCRHTAAAAAAIKTDFSFFSEIREGKDSRVRKRKICSYLVPIVFQSGFSNGSSMARSRSECNGLYPLQEQYFRNKQDFIFSVGGKERRSRTFNFEHPWLSGYLFLQGR